MENRLICFCLFPALLGLVSGAGEIFDDSILYKINWPETGETMVVTTSKKEKYQCVLPSIEEAEKENPEEYHGPNPIQLLAPMFLSTTCTTLLEPYWSYELCHGRSIRQYHEEREGKKMKIQEYTLGKWDAEKTAALAAEFNRIEFSGEPFHPPVKKLDGVNLPYLQLNYTDGTICDLNGKPRQTNVLYGCFPYGKSDIFIIRETSTCEYEAIVTSAELCKHPKYRPKLTGEHPINCLPMDGAPPKPVSLREIEEEAAKQKPYPTFGDVKTDKMFTVYSIGKYKDSEGKMQLRVELRSLDDNEAESAELGADPSEEALTSIAGNLETSSTKVPLNSAPPTDVPFNAIDFLRGRACPEGGYGWWKYKFCYNDRVEQYHHHKEKGIRESIILGHWDQKAHVDWLRDNPNKRPRPLGQRTHVSYFYANGDVCPGTGRVRETEVKLKCSHNKGSVSLYLLEPKMCQYILGVESSIICEFIDKVDEDGLLYF
ncbi:unnamed protein product [Nesidiocoris tenuis]|uniref:Endoplasmic reticulum lectin 1 n=1 Tax=Nesidiocoris tenuis TaxID=355587 RepID=A0A6H5HHC8_9HEMI|nr:unnamed protein product [Nesidiocoris tenuis]